MTEFRSIVAIIVAACVANTAHAKLMVDWGGDYVTATQNFSNGSGNLTHGGFIGGDPILISPASGYNGTSADFYGLTRQDFVTGGNANSRPQVENVGSNDRIQIKSDFAAGEALLLWRQGDFLNGLNTGNVGFDATSTVSMNINSYANFNPGRVVIRLQGGSNDGYYISDETPFNGTGAKSASPTGLTWRAYDPATDLDGVAGTITNIVFGGQIANVTEVGFFVEDNVSSDADAFRLDSFEVSGVVIPEPASLALMGLGGLLMLRRRTS